MRKVFATQSVQDGLLTNQSTASGRGGGGGDGSGVAEAMNTLLPSPPRLCRESLETEDKDKRIGHDRAYPNTLRDYTP